MDGFKKYSLVALPLSFDGAVPETTDSHAHIAQIKASKTALFNTLQKRLFPPPPVPHGASQSSASSTAAGASAAIASTGGADIIEPFTVPELKIGTLDAILVLADELARSDTLFEALLNKIVDQLRILLASDAETLASVLTVGERSPEQFITHFHWNTMKYRIDKSTKELHETILNEATQVEAQMKQKLSAYASIKSALGNVERKQSGSLAVRNLNGVLRPEDFIQNSEYLRTVLVAVPTKQNEEFVATYETLTSLVVPRSHVKLIQESDYTLFSVAIFTRVLDEFTQRAKDAKFIVRDFTYDENAIAQARREVTELTAVQKEQQVPFLFLFLHELHPFDKEELTKLDNKTALLRFLKTNFGEIFAGWLHLKALRLFVETIMRYGLPPRYLSIVIRAPTERASKAVHDQLLEIFKSVKGTGNGLTAAHDQRGGQSDSIMGFINNNIALLTGGNAAPVDIRHGKLRAEDEGDEVSKAVLGASEGDQEYHPYVDFGFNLSWV